MHARNTLAAAFLCVIVGSAPASDVVEAPGTTESHGEGMSLFHDSASLTSAKTSELHWGSTSSVRVVTFGIAFATDRRIRDAHLYRIASGLHDSGFAAKPGPINAVDIVLLENLHPRFQDMTIGMSGEGQPVSNRFHNGSPGLAFRAALEQFNYAPSGTTSQGGGGGHSPSSMSMSSADLTGNAPVILEDTSGTLDWLNSPLGKNGDYGDTSLWGASAFSAGGTSSGDDGDDLMVVPLPVPALLAGIGLASAVVMRRTLRRRGA